MHVRDRSGTETSQEQTGSQRYDQDTARNIAESKCEFMSKSDDGHSFKMGCNIPSSVNGAASRRYFLS